MRIYDPRVGRFLGTDPIGKNYPELTSYQFASNSPISNKDLDGGEAKYYNIDILKTYDAKGKLVNANYTVTEDKSKEAGFFVHGALYRPSGNLGSGTLFTYSQTTVKNLITLDQDVVSQEIKSEDIGSLYVPSPDDEGRGGLFFTSKNGSLENHSPGSLNNGDGDPIDIDLLVKAVGGFPSSTSGGEIEKLRKLPSVLMSNKQIIDKVDKFLSALKALSKAEKSGEKVGEVTNGLISKSHFNRKPVVNIYSGGASPTNRHKYPQGIKINLGNGPDTNYYTQPLHESSKPKNKNEDN